MPRILIPAAIAAVLALLTACSGSQSALPGSDIPDFNVVRYSDTGDKPANLASTVGLDAATTGGTTTVRISIADDQPMIGAAMDLHYDPATLSPVSVEYSGLVEEPIELAAMGVPGVVGLAQASQQGFRARSGDFATVTFTNQPFTAPRAATAVHTLAVNTPYNPPQITTGKNGFDVTKSTAEDGSPATLTIYSIFAEGDGDDNGETNAADISALIIQGNFLNSVSNTNFGPAGTDYDRNGEVNPADITPIALQYLHTLSSIEILLGDAATPVAGDSLRTWQFADGTASNRSPAPFSTTDWTRVFRTWNDSITVEEMAAADTNEDGTVFISARASDGVTPGNFFPGIALTYETGPPNITDISLTFPGAETWAQDPPGSGNYIVIISELSVDGVAGNNEPFAPEQIMVEATVTIDDSDVVQDNTLLLWNVIEGGGLGFVNNTTDKGQVTFKDRGRMIVEAHAIGDFSTAAQITFLLASIDSINLEGDSSAGPLSVNGGDTVQFVPTGVFDWDSTPNGNEVEQDLTGYCNWAYLPGVANTGTFVLSPDTGILNTSNADSGDTVRVTCEYPGTDIIEIFDNQKRASNFVEVSIN